MNDLNLPYGVEVVLYKDPILYVLRESEIILELILLNVDEIYRMKDKRFLIVSQNDKALELFILDLNINSLNNLHLNDYLNINPINYKVIYNNDKFVLEYRFYNDTNIIKTYYCIINSDNTLTIKTILLNPSETIVSVDTNFIYCYVDNKLVSINMDNMEINDIDFGAADIAINKWLIGNFDNYTLIYDQINKTRNKLDIMLYDSVYNRCGYDEYYIETYDKRIIKFIDGKIENVIVNKKFNAMSFDENGLIYVSDNRLYYYKYSDNLSYKICKYTKGTIVVMTSDLIHYKYRENVLNILIEQYNNININKIIVSYL